MVLEGLKDFLRSIFFIPEKSRKDRKRVSKKNPRNLRRNKDQGFKALDGKTKGVRSKLPSKQRKGKTLIFFKKSIKLNHKKDKSLKAVGAKKKVVNKRENIRPQVLKTSIRTKKSNLSAKKKNISLNKKIKQEAARRIKENDDDLLCLGEVTHYFSAIGVVVIKLVAGKIRLGDKIQFKGKKRVVFCQVQSLQVESLDVKQACKGQLVGLKIHKPVRVGDKVYQVK